MDEYIEREAISEEIRKYYYKNPPNSSYGEGFDRGLDRAQRAILDAPAADVAPVRHGRWVIEKRHTVSRNPYIDDNYFASATCSECDFCIHAETKSFGYPDLNTTNYCPNCGAKLDLEE